MAIYEMYPVIDIDNLEEAVCLQCGLESGSLELRTAMFYDDYSNDSYKHYDYECNYEYTGEPWQDEERIRTLNMVNTYLRDILPHYSSVLINVSW